MSLSLAKKSGKKMIMKTDARMKERARGCERAAVPAPRSRMDGR